MHVVRIQPQIDALVVENVFHKEIGEDPVKIITAQMRVAICGRRLKMPFFNFKMEISNVPPPRSYTAIVP